MSAWNLRDLSVTCVLLPCFLFMDTCGVPLPWHHDIITLHTFCIRTNLFKRQEGFIFALFCRSSWCLRVRIPSGSTLSKSLPCLKSWLPRCLTLLPSSGGMVPENSPFTKRHGRLLNLVTSNTDEDMMKVLFQLFDPLHHCFIFPDYRLVPTFEEFSQLLRIPVLNQLPFNGTERDPKPEEISRALHLQQSNMTT